MISKEKKKLLELVGHKLKQFRMATQDYSEETK